MWPKKMISIMVVVAAVAAISKQVQVHSKSALIILFCSRTSFHLLLNRQRNFLSLRRSILRFTSWFGGSTSQVSSQMDENEEEEEEEAP